MTLELNVSFKLTFGKDSGKVKRPNGVEESLTTSQKDRTKEKARQDTIAVLTWQRKSEKSPAHPLFFLATEHGPLFDGHMMAQFATAHIA